LGFMSAMIELILIAAAIADPVGSWFYPLIMPAFVALLLIPGAIAQAFKRS
jgi:hypothetical protein